MEVEEMPMDENSSDERRRYFRVDDVVSLKFTQIPRDTLDARIEQLDRGLETGFTLPSSLAAISHEMRGQMGRIEQLNPTIASYLRALDRKIDLLAQVFLAQQEGECPQTSREVNLSAVGMAFRTDKALEIDAMLELRLLLFPSLTGILTFGCVVKCIHEPQVDTLFPYRIAVKFDYMRDHDRDLLIHHVVQRQYRQLRERRQIQTADEDEDE